MSLKTLLKPQLKKLLKQPIVLKIISFMIFVYTRMVGLTTRWQFGNRQQIDQILSQPLILVGWHSRATMLPFFWNKFTRKNLYALVSPHNDGQIIAHFLKFYGITPINGSTNEKAAQSAIEIMHLLKKQQTIFISPDGPRGPRMRMKKSPIYFASKSGLPIVFAHFSTSRSLFINKAWDKTLLPLPFSHGIFTLSQPLYIPADIDDTQIEHYRRQLENTANEISVICDKMVGLSPTLPADINETKNKRF